MGERTFAEERDPLRDALAELADFAHARESSAVAEAARALDKKLVENRFNVVVLGEFKRGKTTFVNALLGAEMLPAAVVPLTSIVTAVTYGEEIRARIEYLDGREEDVSVQDLTRWVTERDNPANHRGIRHAVLSYPSEDLRDGCSSSTPPAWGASTATTPKWRASSSRSPTRPSSSRRRTPRSPTPSGHSWRKCEARRHGCSTS